MSDVEREGWYVELDGFGVGPYPSPFFARDVLDDFVKNLGYDERMLF
jgi:hypothetical protein